MNSENYCTLSDDYFLTVVLIVQRSTYSYVGFVPILKNETHSQAPRQVYFSVFSLRCFLPSAEVGSVLVVSYSKNDKPSAAFWATNKPWSPVGVVPSPARYLPSQLSPIRVQHSLLVYFHRALPTRVLALSARE